MGSEDDYESCIQAMAEEEERWMMLPVPQRGEIVRQIGNAIREKKEALGALTSLEMGKVSSEGLGEVQEFIDICDMAVGMSRTIDGKVLNSERPGHFMMEQWNPLGPIGVITAFNFPVAPLGWNAAIALICGDQVIWKGASSTSLTTIAVTKIMVDVLKKNGFNSVFTMCQGSGATIGEKYINDKRLHLISFTGSSEIGQKVSEKVHARFGRTILELGGNNAAILMDDCDQSLALKACTFSSVGTAGQRCTTLRRTIIHESIYDTMKENFIKAYNSVPMGDPLDPKVLLGPLHTKAAVKEYLDGLEEIKKQGGKILCGGEKVEGPGNYVKPTLVEIDADAEILKTELFVPIMYLLKFKDLDEAIKIHNNVPQGLSSSIFTKNLQNLFKWTGPRGSDCGIVNCNIGPSGAEIGGAFGGEKETGGGRESGSDSWKQYMRRATCTVNFSNDLPLA
jgi:aldehyde dehydrogenase family 7 protein A1